MTVAFPLSPVPATYGKCSWVQNGVSPNNGIYTVGDTVTITLTKSGANAYTVLDINGNTVSSGAVSGTTCAPAPPAGGWKPGWYRIYFTGPSNDTLFGFSYADTNFTVIRSNANFLPIGLYNSAIGYWDDWNFDNNRVRGTLGIGTPRGQIGSTLDLTGTEVTLTHEQVHANASASFWTASGYVDPVRTRYATCQFPNGTVDMVALPSGNSNAFVNCYIRTLAVNGATTFVSIGAGSVSGAKITVYSPNNTTLVETFDNLAGKDAASAAINTGSAYIKAFTGTGNDAPGSLAATAIGTTRHTNVGTVVSTLYPLITRFEGPTNEPTLSAEYAHQMMIFQDSVHTGNASAKAIGPCPVDVLNLAAWRAFLAAGGGAYCDEISFHAYNFDTSGDHNLGNYTFTNFVNMLASYGLSGKTLWQTESTQAMTCVYGVHHPRRARKTMVDTLLLEQYGIPRERNNYWYDNSHGFWSFPVWLSNGDGSMQPQGALYRTLAEETWAMTHSSKLDFGTPGNNIFLGSIYSGTSGSCAVAMCASYMPNSSVTYQITGATGSLTAVDGWGNTSPIAITPGGLATVPTNDFPSYLRLPVGATATVYSVNDWPQIKVNGHGLNAALNARLPCRVGNQLSMVPRDGKFQTNYGAGSEGGGDSGGVFYTAAALPATATLTWETSTRADRVIVWCSPPWQIASTLLDFDVQTSVDGTTWVTQNTVDNTADAVSFLHGSDSNGTGCQYETYWKEQWIFDVKFTGGPVTCKAIRLNVRACSHGGEPPDIDPAQMGQGDSNERIVLQDIAVLCDANTVKEYLN